MPEEHDKGGRLKDVDYWDNDVVQDSVLIHDCR